MMIAVRETGDIEVLEPSVANQLFNHSSERMSELPDNSIALVNYPVLTDGACGNVPEAQVDQTEI